MSPNWTCCTNHFMGLQWIELLFIIPVSWSTFSWVSKLLMDWPSFTWVLDEHLLFMGSKQFHLLLNGFIYELISFSMVPGLLNYFLMDPRWTDSLFHGSKMNWSTLHGFHINWSTEQSQLSWKLDIKLQSHITVIRQIIQYRSHCAQKSLWWIFQT